MLCPEIEHEIHYSKVSSLYHPQQHPSPRRDGLYLSLHIYHVEVATRTAVPINKLVVGL
jgi:hypothetical protein